MMHHSMMQEFAKSRQREFQGRAERRRMIAAVRKARRARRSQRPVIRLRQADPAPRQVPGEAA